MRISDWSSYVFASDLGEANRDDARQAPVSHEHLDLYAQGPTTDTRFKGGEHIPGLNVGGWFDAGDFDIRTQSQYAVVRRSEERRVGKELSVSVGLGGRRVPQKKKKNKTRLT